MRFSSGYLLRAATQNSIANLCSVTLKIDGILPLFGNKTDLHLPLPEQDQSVGPLPKIWVGTCASRLGTLPSTSFRSCRHTSSSVITVLSLRY
jgi:hypothetical protein